MKLVFIFIVGLWGANSALAACANTVAQAKQNGVYKHFLKLTGQKEWVTLTRRSDGKSFSGGIRGNYFKVIGYSVRVCKQGANGISAEKSFIKGYITRRKSGRKYVYVVTGLGNSYNGTYELK